ncbi:hypothetical protein [Aureliella helgolandensis]|uniref:Uncharacterized protein n=1 Tax=Aureliella helgolandensis TaxID=2527968 RepID=A0A518G6R0_9BACT|nr:hypothetical protein [Aureliella helgolandensis]QDV24272.1 hypothetical protein Q31a_25870 [Aureliella helgolandensis]
MENSRETEPALEVDVRNTSTETEVDSGFETVQLADAAPVPSQPADIQPATSETATSEPATAVADGGEPVASELDAGEQSLSESVDGEPVAGDGATDIASASEIDDPKSLELSEEFIGRWTTLISTTNWEKGQIIQQWREALMGSESPVTAYSDEAWSRRVGGVTAQHVGRLRRVSERFGESHPSYTGLYWSHFLAALDWDDAELWLEGAAQSHWSVSQMRRTRWESMGGDPAKSPSDADIQHATDDEDFTPLSEVEEDNGSGKDRQVAEGPRSEGPDFGDENDVALAAQGTEAPGTEVEDNDDLPWEEDASSTEPVDSPFARLPSLPVDMAEALEQFKLAIIRHRANSWSEVSQDDCVQGLEALRLFALQ